MSQAQNTLTEQEKAEGWQLLFDGSSTDGWRGYNDDSFPEQGWVAEDGMLTVQADGGGGDIITEKEYENFVLKFEWKVEKCGKQRFVLPSPGAAYETDLLVGAGSADT